MKQLSYFFILLLLIACSGKSQNLKDMVINTEKVKTMQDAFKKQDHRIEINNCEIIYNNDKSFFLDTTLEELKTLFGEPDYNELRGYAWSDEGIIITKNKDNNKVKTIYIYVSQSFKEVLQPNDRFFLFNGIPFNRKMNFADLIDNSLYEFDDFAIGKHSYDLVEDACGNDPFKIRFSFSSPVPYDYSGGGHLQIRGTFRPDLTGPIDLIVISKVTKN